MGDDFEIFQAIWEEITVEVVSDERVVLITKDNEVALEHQGGRFFQIGRAHV